jgi:hypothetical protein
MPRSDFKDTIADTMIDLLKTNLGSAGFKQYYYGDPIAIPQSQLPAVVVEFESSDITVSTTAQDDVDDVLVIKLVFNKKSDFNKTASEIAGHRRLRELMQGVDSTTGKIAANTVIGILRANFTLSNTIVDQSIGIEYGIMPRPEDVITEEAHARISTRQILTVSRS